MNERIAEKREDELRMIWKGMVLDMVNGAVNVLIPILTMVATYATYVSALTIHCS